MHSRVVCLFLEGNHVVINVNIINVIVITLTTAIVACPFHSTDPFYAFASNSLPKALCFWAVRVSVYQYLFSHNLGKLHRS